jgi:hypothetical protein
MKIIPKTVLTLMLTAPILGQDKPVTIVLSSRDSQTVNAQYFGDAAGSSEVASPGMSLLVGT